MGSFLKTSIRYEPYGAEDIRGSGRVDHRRYPAGFIYHSFCLHIKMKGMSYILWI